MDTEAAQALVRQLPLLAGLSEDVRDRVAKVFVDVSDLLLYSDGEPLIHAGYLSFDTGFVLLDGKAGIEVVDGDEIEIEGPALLGEMSQFRSADLRNATVRAKGPAHAIQFFWDDLYSRSEETLEREEQSLLRVSIEKQVWERFEYKNILSLAMFNALSDDVKQKVCYPLTSITERQSLRGVETLFNVGSRCNAAGHLIVRGSVKLIREGKNDKIIEAPNIIGIFPGKAEKGTEWTATVMAHGEADILMFSWEQYTSELVHRLSREEQHKLIASIKENGAHHFWH